MTKWIYSFGDGTADGNAGMKDLLGGKGIALIFRELEEYDITELLDRVGRDAHGADFPFDTNPFVSFGVLEFFGIFHLFLVSTPADE